MKDQGGGQKGIVNEADNEGGAKEQQDFQVARPPTLNVNVHFKVF